MDLQANFRALTSQERGGFGSKHVEYDLHDGNWRQAPEERRAVINDLIAKADNEAEEFDKVLAEWLAPQPSTDLEY